MVALQRNFFPSQIIEGSGIAVVLNADGTVSVSADLTTDDLPTISISTIDGLQSVLDDKADAAHSLSDHSDINISNPEVGSFLRYTQATFGADKWEAKFLTASDIPSLPISKITDLQSTLDGKASSSHALLSHSDVYLVNPDPVAGQLPIYQAATGGMFGQPAGYYLRTLTASDIPSLPISKITDLQSTLDAKADAASIPPVIMRGSLFVDGGTIEMGDQLIPAHAGISGTITGIRISTDCTEGTIGLLTSDGIVGSINLATDIGTGGAIDISGFSNLTLDAEDTISGVAVTNADGSYIVLTFIVEPS